MLAARERRSARACLLPLLSRCALAAALPLIAFVYDHWGFDTLSRILAAAAAVILLAVELLLRVPV